MIAVPENIAEKIIANTCHRIVAMLSEASFVADPAWDGEFDERASEMLITAVKARLPYDASAEVSWIVSMARVEVDEADEYRGCDGAESEDGFMDRLKPCVEILCMLHDEVSEEMEVAGPLYRIDEQALLAMSQRVVVKGLEREAEDLSCSAAYDVMAETECPGKFIVTVRGEYETIARICGIVAKASARIARAHNERNE